MGKVYLVGAGPGDPGLITYKGVQALKKADVVVYDRLVNPLLLYLAPKKAVLHYVGKAPQRHTLTQEQINQKLVDLGSQDLTVVRLKGGDPSIFGRVGEEAATLTAAGVPFEIIPGITSASATVYAGFSVTERFVSEKCLICTPTAKLVEFAKEPLAKISQGGSVVIYMGMERLAEVCQHFLAQEADPNLPVAVIQWESWGRQEKVVATLATVVAKVAQKELQNPALVVVGPVAKNGEAPSWFEQLPDFGKRLLYVTDKALSFDDMLYYTSKGVDFYPYYVGQAYDQRFDDLHERMALDFKHYQVEYASAEAKTAFESLPGGLNHEGN
ncbi:uroporphyrinogen-III C-methyltransferase [Enterococcus sp. 2201sp1_2201st1_B8_2201SCRN_220225]|uniref:uroporphyrinogen-III C-methyltransferase n=1 Tax=unclassified Enterococcus TaxID=2608891 RepID=UPI0034A46EFA